MLLSRLSTPTLLCGLFFSSVPVRADHHGKSTTPLLKTGDRIALVGGGLIERARLNGYLETALTAGAGPKVTGLKFRNLGWSGDTVFNDARSYFGKPKEGRDRLKKIIAEWKPNVVLLNYGAEVALSAGRAWTDEASASKRSAGDWDESVAVFLEGYAKMIEELNICPGISKVGEPGNIKILSQVHCNNMATVRRPSTHDCVNRVIF